MSNENHNNEPSTSARTVNVNRLTAANLAARDQNTSAMSADHAVRCWLDDTETMSGRYVDKETWTRLVERDIVAAAIETAVDSGAQKREK